MNLRHMVSAVAVGVALLAGSLAGPPVGGAPASAAEPVRSHAVTAPDPHGVTEPAQSCDGLRPGDRGPCVVQLQSLLRQCGYPVEVTGVFDQQTLLALTRFQRDVGLPVDGVVGPRTWRVLLTHCA